MVNYLELSIQQAGAPINVNIQFCYNALDDSQATIQSYCRTEYATYLEYGGLPSNQSCSVSLNDQACDSCTMAKCNATGSIESPAAFDCSDVESDVVVEDLCSGNTIWKQLFAADYPTTEPTGYPTFMPAAGGNTPSPLARNDDSLDNAPTIAIVPTAAPASSAIGNATTDASRAWMETTWSVMPVIASGLVGLAVALN